VKEFLPFWLEFLWVPSTFYGRKRCLFLKKNIFRNTTSFFFSGQMSLGLIVELLKKAPVILKRLESFWQIALIQSRFSGYLSVAVGRRHCSVTGQ